jgi:hypothetical protein
LRPAAFMPIAAKPIDAWPRSGRLNHRDLTIDTDLRVSEARIVCNDWGGQC